MAKGKHTTALFDVIHAAKKPPKSSPSAAMPTPRWWAKDKKKLPASVPPIGETAGKQPSWLAAARKTAGPLPGRASTQQTAADQTAADRVGAGQVAAEPGVDQVSAEPQDTSSQSVVEYAERSDVTRTATEEPAADESSVPAAMEKPVTTVRWMPRSAVAAPITSTVESESGAEEETDETPPLVAEVKTRFRDRVRSGSDEAGETGRSNGHRAEPPVAAVDRVAKEVSFRFSYAGLAGLAVIVLLAMTLAFVVGGRYYALRNQAKTSGTNLLASDGGKGSPTASGNGTPSGAWLSAVGTMKPAGSPTPPAYRPDVAEPRPHNATTATTAPPMVTQTPTVPSVRTTPRTTVSTPAAVTPPIDNPRVAGRMYVIIKSYPDGDGEAAATTAALLNANGVPCSVVRGLKNYLPDGWYSIVGYQSFKSADSPECLQYAKVLAGLRPKFAGRPIRSNRPESQLYPWTADAEQN